MEPQAVVADAATAAAVVVVASTASTATAAAVVASTASTAAAAAAADIASGQQQRLRTNDSFTTLTSLPDAIHIMIIKFIAIDEELSKLIRVSKQFSNIICHKYDNNNNNKFQITVYKKEFHVPLLTLSPKIENCVGNKIRKRFDRDYYNGKITSYDHHTRLYKVKYIDGDDDDVELCQSIC